MDGSLFKHHPRMKQWMNQFIDILAPGYSVSIVLFIISNYLIKQPFENDTVIILAIKSAEILLDNQTLPLIKLNNTASTTNWHSTKVKLSKLCYVHRKPKLKFTTSRIEFLSKTKYLWVTFLESPAFSLFKPRQQLTIDEYIVLVYY